MKKVLLIAFLGTSTLCSFAGDPKKTAGAETTEKPVSTVTVNENDDPLSPPPGETIYRSTRNSTPVRPGEEDGIIGTNVYSGSAACRSYWLAQPIFAGSTTTNDYYYDPNGTGTQTTPPSIFITYCP